MRTVALSIMTTAALTVLALNTASAQIPWQENLRTAHTQAQAQGKLLLLHFYSDNCVWCDRLEAGSFRDPSVSAAISKGYVPVKVHGGKNPKLTEMFKVSKFPTDVIVTTEGKTLSHSVSPQEPKRYVAMLAGVASQNQPVAPAARAPVAQVPAGAPAAAPIGPVAVPSGPAAVPSYAQNPPAPSMSAPSVAKSAPAATKPSDFNLPSAKLGGSTQASLAGSRSNATSLTMPGEVPIAKQLSQPVPESQPVAKSPSTTKPAVEPELAMQGYCSVTVINEDRWVEGNPKYGVIHLGKLYLFTDAEKMQTFLADPVPYTPVLNEIDVVRFFEERKIVKGKREWGLKDPTYNRMFFFADKAAMDHFYNEYDRYTDASIEVMEKAIKDANPGT